MVFSIFGGKDADISRFKSALKGESISANTQKGYEEMEHINWLVSLLLDTQREDFLNLIRAGRYIQNQELPSITTPEEFKAYYIRKAQEREKFMGVRPIVQVLSEEQFI